MKHIRPRGTGFIEQVDTNFDKIPEFDSRTGDHLWLVLTAYRVNPEVFIQGDSTLATDNLVSVAGPGCYYCERNYHPLLATRRCKGSV